MAQNKTSNRQELDINVFTAILGAVFLTVLIYIFALSFRQSYLGNLLFDRGVTQYLTIFTSCLVASLTLSKYLKIAQEKKVFKKLGVPENVDFSNHKSVQLVNLQEDFARTSSMVTNRIARVFTAYIQSGSRKSVSEFVLDDSSFYQSASESSYALPRILVWAIPLLGFIGTVIGISTAVSGFTGFLENTAEIEQIKEGIGSVTGGLAVAFDTTLLALLLSVVVMIPLVLVEKMEGEVLLATDIYINDHIIPRLMEKSAIEQASLNSEKLVKTIQTTIETSLPNKEELVQPIKDALPTPEQLISPAQIYAKEAAQNIASELVQQLSTIHKQEQELIDQIKEINESILQDRQSFRDTFSEQNQLNLSVIDNVRELVDLVKDNSLESQQSFQQASVNIINQLNKAAMSLENKVGSLEKSSEKIAQLSQLQSHLEKIVTVLSSVDQMQDNLSGIKEQIAQLEPTLKNLGKPRVVRLVEQIDE